TPSGLGVTETSQHDQPQPGHPPAGPRHSAHGRIPHGPPRGFAGFGPVSARLPPARRRRAWIAVWLALTAAGRSSVPSSGGLPTGTSRSTYPIIISSKVCSPQRTNLVGSGLYGLLVELSK